MSELKFQKEINASKLLEEFKESGLMDKVQDLTTKGDQVVIITRSDLSIAEETALQSLIEGHTKENEFDSQIEDARHEISLGLDLLAEVSVGLRRREPSPDQLLDAVRRFSEFQLLILGGYADLAKDVLQKIPVDDLVSQDLIDQLLKKIQTRRTLTKSDGIAAAVVKDG